MKRILFSVAGTILGLVGLLSFKSHGTPLAGAGTFPGPALAGSPGTGAHRTHAQPSTSAPPRRPGHNSPHRTAPHSTAPANTTILGRPVQTPYEVVQVRVSVSGSRITNVSYARLTGDTYTSQQINHYVAPILVRQTLQAQSAHINGVSGASYTTAGYEQSLQSALDKVGLR